MGESEKRRLVPIEIAYYCMLASVDASSVVEGWIDTKTSAVELVKVGFIDRIAITPEMTGAPRP